MSRLEISQGDFPQLTMSQNNHYHPPPAIMLLNYGNPSVGMFFTVAIVGVFLSCFVFVTLFRVGFLIRSLPYGS